LPGTSSHSSLKPTGLRVLLVEDESIIAMLLEDVLQQLGHQVVGPAARVSKAMELAEHEALDVAILDVNLNGQKVYPVAAVLAARGIPFVFASGYGRDSLPAPYGDRPTLIKPFQWRDLEMVLAQVQREKETASTAAGKSSPSSSRSVRPSRRRKHS
jgi:CheY-like chemotaxis protein